MYKTLKKFGALLLAVMMLLALGSTAFATVDPDLGTYEGSMDKSAPATTVPVTKSLIIFNPEDGTVVREPNIKFVYAVTPVTAAAELGTITDDGRNNQIGGVNTPVTVKVNAGVPDGVTGVTLTFEEANTVAAKPTGVEVEKSGNLSIDISKFTHAGVYRYLITESVQNLSGTAITDLTTYGLEARTADYETTRYLDLYISNQAAPATGLELTGAVIFKTNTEDDSHTPATDAITTTTDKTTGFEPGTVTPASGNADYTNDADVDRYFTYNLKVGKTTTGALADKTHDFPFEIKLTAASTLVPTVKTDLTVSGATNETDGVRNIANSSVLTLSPKMSNGDYIELKGIPKGTTVTVKETNDTADTYTASWDTTAGTTSTATVASDNTDTTNLNLASNKSASASAVAIDGNQTTEYVKTVLGFTNNLAEISPTGVALRFAPYALMLGAGFFFFLISKRRREEAAEA